MTRAAKSEAERDSEVLLESRLSERDVELIAVRVADLISDAGGRSATSWLDVRATAVHVGMSAHAIRGLVKRGQIPFHRTPNHRLRFLPAELDEWVRSGLAESTSEDLP